MTTIVTTTVPSPISPSAQGGVATTAENGGRDVNASTHVPPGPAAAYQAPSQAAAVTTAIKARPAPSCSWRSTRATTPR